MKIEYLEKMWDKLICLDVVFVFIVCAGIVTSYLVVVHVWYIMCLCSTLCLWYLSIMRPCVSFLPVADFGLLFRVFATCIFSLKVAFNSHM